MCLTYQQRIMAPRFTSAQVFRFSIPTRSTSVLPKQTVKYGKEAGEEKNETISFYKEAYLKFSVVTI